MRPSPALLAPSTRWAQFALIVLSTAVATALLWLVYGLGTAGYDASYALVWGSELVSGQSPSFNAPFAPTPHPLSNVEAMALQVFGDSQVEAMAWLALVMHGALLVVGFLLGRKLYSAAVGVVFAVFLATLEPLLASTQQAVIDVQFLLIVLTALFLALPGRSGKEHPLAAAVALAAAGLLRPEAWAIAIGYLLFLNLRVSSSDKSQDVPWLALVAVVATAPAAWLLFDLLATGDPFHSLHGTQALAEQLDRHRDSQTAIKASSAYLRILIGPSILAGGLIGMMVALRIERSTTLILVAIVFLALVCFVLLGLFGLPLIVRYLILPAALIALFCSVALVGWAAIPRADRPAWLYATAALTLAFLILGGPRQFDLLRQQMNETKGYAATRSSATAAGENSEVVKVCRPMQMSEFAFTPALALASGIRPDQIVELKPGQLPTKGTLIVSQAQARALDLHSAEGFSIAFENRGWLVASTCPSTPPAQ